jgi:hypothetical protein
LLPQTLPKGDQAVKDNVAKKDTPQDKAQDYQCNADNKVSSATQQNPGTYHASNQ